MNLSLYTVDAVLVLDSEGHRVLAKYYRPKFEPSKDQRAFEKGLWHKTKKPGGAQRACILCLLIHMHHRRSDPL